MFSSCRIKDMQIENIKGRDTVKEMKRERLSKKY